jgi:KaiC/GvpD/RAD55 family RecA-like ATPase
MFDEAQREVELETRPGLVLRCFRDIEPKPLRWLWPGRIPLGKLTLFAGDPGLGKSFVTLDVAARVTRGESWPDGAPASCQVGSVIVLSAEDDPSDTIRPRLEAAGANLSKVHVLQAVRREKPDGETSLEHFSLETDLVALQDAVASFGDARLVVIDPISAYLGNTDSHINAKVRGLVSPLADIAAGLDVAVVAVTHLNKSTSSALYRACGSIAFIAAARAVWLFGKNPDDPAGRLMLPGKMNLAPEQMGIAYTLASERHVAVVAWGAAVSVSADVMLEPEGAERRSERIDAIEWLRERLSSGAVAQREIKREAAKEGFSWATVRRAKDALGIIAEKSGYQGPSQWRLRNAHSKGAQPRTPQVSTFERPTENSSISGNSPAKDARPTQVSTFEDFEDNGEVRL